MRVGLAMRVSSPTDSTVVLRKIWEMPARPRGRRAGSTPEPLDAFRGVLTGIVAGGLLWLGLALFVFSLLRFARPV